MIRIILMFLITAFALNVWADNIAESQAQAKNRYRDFIKKVKSDAANDKMKSLEIDRLRAQRAQSQELKEKARREFVAKREIRRKNELTSAMRDEYLEKQLEKERQRTDERRLLFVRQHELIRKALKSVRQVDPHDEYEVGKNYLDDSGEVEEEAPAGE